MANYMFDVVNPMTQAEALEWADALESGKYKQGKGALVVGRGRNVSYCCLGVERKVHPAKCRGVNDRELLRGGLGEDFRLLVQDQQMLAQRNDGGVNFSEIAAYIRTSIVPRLPK